MTSNTPFGEQPSQPGGGADQRPPTGGPDGPSASGQSGFAAQPGFGPGPLPSHGSIPSYGTAGQPQTQPGGASAWSGGGGEEIGSGDPPSGGSKRGAVPWIIGLVVVLVLGGGAVAVRAALGDSTGGPAQAVPGSAVAFARLDVDPSAGQKVQALRLANRFPSFGDMTGLTDPEADLRSSLFDSIKGQAPGLADMDFAADVEPWLGSSVGVALLPPEGDSAEPSVALALEVTDQAAAEDGIAKLLAGGDAETSAGYAFTGSYAVFAMTQELADSYAAAAEESPLADDEEYTNDMSALGDEGVASAWISSDAAEVLGELASDLQGAVPGAGGAGLGALGASPAVPFQSGSAAYALRFEEQYVEIAMAGSGSEVELSSSDSDSPIGGLPESTLFAVSVANGGQYVQQAIDQLTATAEQTGQDIERQINRFEKQTGLAVPEDFVTLLGDHFTVAVDADLGNLDSPADLRVGALLDTDTAAAQEVIDKLVAVAGGGVDLASVEADGLLAVAPNEDYAGELTGGSLGDTAAFDQAVAYGADSDITMFFSIDALHDLEMLASQMGDEAAANLEPLEAVGLSVQFTGDGESRGSFRITFDE